MARPERLVMTSGAGARTREQRTIWWGASVVVIAWFAVRVAGPFIQTWQVRATQLAAAEDRLAQLRGLTTQAPALAQAATVAERELAGAPRRVLHAPTAALAGSALQSVLQNATDAAGMLVNRVDVGPDDAASDVVGGTLSVVGDIHGLAQLLESLATGPRVVRVEEMTVTQNSALRGAPDVLQVTLRVRAPIVLDSTATGGAP